MLTDLLMALVELVVGPAVGAGGAWVLFRRTHVDYKGRWQETNRRLIAQSEEQALRLVPWSVSTRTVPDEGEVVFVTNGKREVTVAAVAFERKKAADADLQRLPFSEALKRCVERASDVAAEFNARDVE